MQNSPFTVAGMSSSTTAHHSQNINTWGSTSTGGSAQLGASFGESLSQSRSHYQPGYLMSSQSNTSPQGNQRVDEVPIVQTKAKMNHMLSRGPSDFGMNSMFESTRQKKLADEDAPPTNSVNDIPNEVGLASTPLRASTRASADEVPLFARRPQRPAASTPPQATTGQQPIYIVVFGYPPEKYSSTVEFFQSLGATTDPDPHLEIQNCFRIGFTDSGDALRAMRKNGEVLGGSWMIGVKWADAGQAEAILSQVKTKPATQAPDDEMAVDEPGAPTTPASQPKGTPTGLKGSGGYTTPLKVVPASAAFRKRNPDAVATPQPQRAWSSINANSLAQPQPQPQPLQQPQTSSPNKGMLGQVSDLIFGW